MPESIFPLLVFGFDTFGTDIADMRALRAVLSSSVWEIHGSVGEIPATGRY